jgi:RHS repeat-associated protein
MIKTARSSSVWFGNQLFRILNIVLVLALVSQSFSFTVPVQAKVVEPISQENLTTNKQAQIEKPNNTSQSPRFEHPTPRLSEQTSNATDVNRLLKAPTNSAVPINFNTYTPTSFGTNDVKPTMTIEENGSTLHIKGNCWKKINFPYILTPYSVIEFDFKSTAQAEVQGLGFDTDQSMTEGYMYKFYGTQSWGITHNLYWYSSAAPGWKHYRIPIGGSYTGTFPYLVFMNDHDVSNPTGESYFRNVQVYEDPSTYAQSPVDVDFSNYTISQYSGTGQNPSIRMSVEDSGKTLSMVGNGWLKMSLPYQVTSKTVMEFDYKSTSLGEIQGIGFSENDNQNSYRTFQVYGSDYWGWTTMRYSKNPQWAHFRVPVGKYFTGNMRYVFFANDDDVVNPTSNNYFRNLNIYEGDLNLPIQADFSNYNFSYYASGGGGTPRKLIEDFGKTLHLVGNGWTQFSMPITITQNTTIEFDFKSTSQGEVHGIGFDTDVQFDTGSVFQLYGTQSFGINSFRNYAQSAPGYKHYKIPVGNYYTDERLYLFFANDDDVTNSVANSYFSNLEIYDSGFNPNADIFAGSVLNQGEIKSNSPGSTDTECPISTTCATQKAYGDPINSRTGAFSFSLADLNLQTSAGPLVFQRSYSSGSVDQFNNPLGYGWMDNHSAKLIFPTDPNGMEGFVLFQGVLGNKFLFKVESDGSYSPGPGVIASLTKSTTVPVTYSLTTSTQDIFNFDENGKINARRDPNGHEFTYEYSIDGHLSKVNADEGTKFIQFGYNTDGLISSVSDHANRQVTFGYDADANLISSVDVLGQTWEYAYDVNHHMTQMIDPTDHETVTNEYDALGRVFHQYDAKGDLVLTITYNEDNTSTITDAGGQSEKNRFDSRGTVIQVSDQSAIPSNTTYDSNFRPSIISDEVGDTTNLTWSDDGVNLTQVQDALGQTTSINYDNLNNITSTVNSANFQTEYFYEDFLHPTLLTRSIDALGAETTYSYDADGNLLSITDPLNHTTTYGYDAYGNRTSMTNALNETTTYSYDAFGWLIGTVTPDNRVSHYSYNSAGYLVQSIQNYDLNKTQNQDNQYNITTTYEYDFMGRQTKVIDTYSRQTSYEYDDNGRLLKTIDPDGNETTNSYNTLGQLVASTDTLGRIISYEYNAKGLLTKTTNPAGYVTRSEYNADGTLRESIDPDGNPTSYTYDDLKRMLSTTDAEGNTTYTTYDAAGNVATNTDAMGNTTTYTYDALGRQIKQTFEDGSYTETFYDGAGNQIQTKDAKGNATTNEFDELNRLKSSTDAKGNVTSYTYSSSGQQATVTDPLGNVTSYAYDTLGRTVSVTFPGGGNNSTTYDALGNVINSTDAKGETTTNAYDVLNRLVSSTDPGGHVTSYTYHAGGNRLTMTDGNGNTTTYRYNNLNQLVEETNALGKSTRFTYDVIGNTTSVSNPTGATTTYTYDNLGRQTSVKNAKDVVVDYLYDANGNRIQMKDGRNVNTRYQYNDKGLLVSVTENYRSGVTGDNETNVTTEYSYDANGNRTGITDAKGNETTFTYDELNRLVSESDALDNTTSYSYDAAGKRVTVADAMGRTTRYTYSVRGLLTNIDYPDPDADVSYSYDANGQRIGMQDGLGSTSWNVDSLGRATSITDPFNRTVGYSYDAVGNRTGMRYPDGKTVQYQYDDLNRMTTVTDWQNLVTGYTYDDDNQVASIQQPNNLVTLFSRDEIGQVTGVTNSLDQQQLSTFGYIYDENGNRTSVTENLTSPGEGKRTINVRVVDTVGSGIASQIVYVYDGETNTGISAFSDSNGYARFVLPTGIFRFVTELNGKKYYSGDANHCDVTVCFEATIPMPVFKQVVVTVKDAQQNLLPGLEIEVYDGQSPTGLSTITTANGVAIFTLPEGNYRFKTEKNGVEVFSSTENQCNVPICTEVSFLITEQTASINESSKVAYPSVKKGFARLMQDDPTPVTVTVLDTASQPQANLTVRAYNGDTDTGISGTTDTNGQVILNLSDGSYRIRVDKFSNQYFSNPNNHCDVPACSAINVTVPIYTEVSVTVTDSSSTPQQGLSVTSLTGTTTVGEGVTTGSDGMAIFNLPEGSYRFRTSFNNQEYFSSTENNCTVPTCTPAGITLPQFADVSVTVTDSANVPQSGLVVQAYNGAQATGIEATTGSDGTAVLTLPEGSYHFLTATHNLEYYSNTENSCTVPTCTTAGIIVPQYADVAVTVTNSASITQSGLVVQAYNGTQVTGFEGVTGTNGIAVLTLPEGSYRFRTTTHNLEYFSSTENACVVPTCTTSSITVSQFADVTVTVTDSASAPQSGLVVQAYNNDLVTGIEATTGTDGTAVLTLPEGSYRFRTAAHNLEYFTSAENGCTVPTCTTAGITVPQFVDVTVTVMDSSSAPQSGLVVQAYNADQVTGIEATTGTNGTAILTLPEGSYRFHTTKDNRSFFSSDANHCAVPECNSAAINIIKWGFVTIDVKDSTNTVQANIPVSALQLLNGELKETGIGGISDANGQVVMNLPEGAYRFRSIHHGFFHLSTETDTVEVPTETTGLIIEPVFHPVGVIVSDSEQHPQENTQVYLYNADQYSGTSMESDVQGSATFMLPEGSNFRFRADQPLSGGSRSLITWSDPANHCIAPTCTQVKITVPETDYHSIEQTINYTYDPLNRLTAADYGSSKYFHYTYDEVGNRTTQELALNSAVTSITYDYDNANRLSAVDAQSYTFDANGNLLSDGENTYTYDSANRLIGFSKEGMTVTNYYNGQGDRLQQTVNGVENKYTLDLNTGLTQVLNDKDNTYLYGLNRLEYERTGDEYQYLTDALGSVRQVVKTGGDNSDLILTKSYAPYGDEVFSNGIDTPYGFTGEMQSGGLVHLRARDYSPEYGRFLTRDSWAGDSSRPLSLNKWGYVEGNPINLKDPNGRCYGPLGFLRNVPIESGICEHLDQAMFVYAWHGSTSTQRDMAAAYIGGWAFGHSGIIVGVGGLSVAGGQAAIAGGKAAIAWLTNLYIASQYSQQIAQGCQNVTVWVSKPFQRGVEIENIIGRSPELVQNFPEIDRWKDGIATSIKSIDLGANSFQNINTLVRTVQSYAITLSNWQGARWANVIIDRSMIEGRELILAIPPNASIEQMQALSQVQVWAQNIGVVLRIVIIP